MTYDPEDLTLTQQGDDVLLEWPAAVHPGTTEYWGFRRAGESDNPFDPESETPLFTVPSTQQSYLYEGAAKGWNSYQVFPYAGEPPPVEVLSDLDDVDTAGAQDGDELTFFDDTNEWRPAP
jgi:hypothetical protein